MHVLRNALRGFPFRPFAVASVEHFIDMALRGAIAFFTLVALLAAGFAGIAVGAGAVAAGAVVEGGEPRGAVGVGFGAVACANTAPAEMTSATAAEVMVEIFILIS